MYSQSFLSVEAKIQQYFLRDEPLRNRRGTGSGLKIK